MRSPSPRRRLSVASSRSSTTVWRMRRSQPYTPIIVAARNSRCTRYPSRYPPATASGDNSSMGQRGRTWWPSIVALARLPRPGRRRRRSSRRCRCRINTGAGKTPPPSFASAVQLPPQFRLALTPPAITSVLRCSSRRARRHLITRWPLPPPQTPARYRTCPIAQRPVAALPPC